MAQLIKHPTSAQVLISQFVGSRLMLGSGLTARSLEPALDSVSSSLSRSKNEHKKKNTQVARVWAGEGQRERETQNLKQALGSELSAQSLTRGLNSPTVRS